MKSLDLLHGLTFYDDDKFVNEVTEIDEDNDIIIAKRTINGIETMYSYKVFRDWFENPTKPYTWVDKSNNMIFDKIDANNKKQAGTYGTINMGHPRDMLKQYNDSLPKEEVKSYRCECGAQAIGHADFTPMHSSWCPARKKS